jgi:DHA1 family tetracycline resistance protein-like MFS transporter
MNQKKRGWQKWIEPWYMAYAVLGLTVAGLVPVLIPLIVSRSGNAGLVGLVVAAVSLGGLSAPLWGSLADRHRLHRLLLAGGMLIASVGLAAFALTTNPVVWCLLALVQGLGSASAATVANLFVVEAHPKSEWDQRIGWLQTTYGIGQVAGLLLVGYLTKTDLRTGFWLAAGLCAVGASVGWFTTKTPLAQPGLNPVLLHPVKHSELTISSPQRSFHSPNMKGLKHLGQTLHSPFGVFLLVWLLAFAGPAAVFSQYPVLMQKLFGTPPSTASFAFAIVAAVGLSLYTPAGNWSKKQGPILILRGAQVMRWLAFSGMLWLAFTRTSASAGWLALLLFGFVVLAWSLMSVSGTALAAQLSPVGEGQGLGIFNAMTAIAAILGAVLGGWTAQIWGYQSILGLAIIGVALGIGFSFWVKKGR